MKFVARHEVSLLFFRPQVSMSSLLNIYFQEGVCGNVLTSWGPTSPSLWAKDQATS